LGNVTPDVASNDARLGVLVTRPEPGGAETASRVAALGWRAVVAPALVLAPRRFVMPHCQAVLVTSRAAARALAPVPGLPLLAVGEATAAEARARGWDAVEAAAGTADDLAEVAAMRLHPASGALLLAVGEGYGAELSDALRARGFAVLRRVAYRAAPAAALPAEAVDALRAGSVGTVLFHSPRSAACAITLLRAAGLAGTASRMGVLAISRRVAEAAADAIAPLAWRGIRTAARPEEDALLRLLGPRGTGTRGGPGSSGES